MSGGVFKLTNVTPSRRILALFPAQTRKVHAYVLADNAATAARVLGEVLGSNVREGTVKIASQDTIPDVLTDAGILFRPRGEAASPVILHGPIATTESLIVKATPFASQVIGRIHGRGRDATFARGNG